MNTDELVEWARGFPEHEHPAVALPGREICPVCGRDIRLLPIEVPE